MGHSRIYRVSRAHDIFNDKSSDPPLSGFKLASRRREIRAEGELFDSHTSASRNRNAKLRHRCCRNSWIYVLCALLSTASVQHLERGRKRRREEEEEEDLVKGKGDRRFIIYPENEVDPSGKTSQGTRDVHSCVSL